MFQAFSEDAGAVTESDLDRTLAGTVPLAKSHADAIVQIQHRSVVNARASK